MVAVTVTWNGTRIDEVNGASTAANIGGGAGSGGEPDIVYQGAEERSRKVGTAASGFAITPAIIDISTGTGTYQTLVMKYAAGNWAALETLATPGMEARIGTAAAVYAQYDFAGADAYPEKGGFVFLCVDPNIAGYRTATNGSPNFASTDYFGIVGDFTATSKAENLVHSAIDVGDGYTVTGGGGADPTAGYSDVAAFNSIITNRQGFLFALEGQDGAFGQYGTMRFGSLAAAVDYQDVTAPTVFLLDGFYAAGWSGIEDNLENASTVIAPVGGSWISRGNTDVTDTRSVYNVVGTASSGTRTAQTFKNFAEFNCLSSMTYVDFDIQSASFTQGGATFDGATTLRSTALVSAAFCSDLDLSGFESLRVVQDGAGHFVDLGTISSDTPLTWTPQLDGFRSGVAGDPVSTTSFGDEAILVDVASGFTLTITIASGATIPSVKNDGAGDVVVVVPQVTVTFEGLSVGGEFRIYDDDGDGNAITLGTNREGVETLAATSYTLTHQTSESGDIISAQFMQPGVFEEEVLQVVLGTADQTISFNLTPEEND